MDGSITVDFSERKRLVDGGALVSKSVDGSLGVDGDADSKTSGNSRGGSSWGWEILNRNARNVLELGLEFGHAQCSVGDL